MVPGLVTSAAQSLMGRRQQLEGWRYVLHFFISSGIRQLSLLYQLDSVVQHKKKCWTSKKVKNQTHQNYQTPWDYQHQLYKSWTVGGKPPVSHRNRSSSLQFGNIIFTDELLMAAAQ
ncbi:hypothetical protein ATANTOWER_032340 [Ataeniobius toweri]|uniref:Uncharacterized protein n=1 Tax=Ataeniobius toweri TaxID=208326 RepID=A0ABU7CDH6_9TELE|nr:hypothetical protein [Ataeniobius toweri]